MVWPQSEILWKEKALLSEVFKDIVSVANAVVSFEPVVVFADPGQVSFAKKMLDSRIEVVEMNVDDLWARDTFPAFVSKVVNEEESISGVVFNFNGWGNKQIHNNDAQVARKVLELYSLESRTSKIVAEGGSLETDGRGTLLATKSSLVNENRNKISLHEIEIELKEMLGVKKIIWFDGVKNKDITDTHVDCLARFVRPGVVILNRSFPGKSVDSWSLSSDQALTVLNSSTDADGNTFKVIELFEPDPSKIVINGNPKNFLSSYVNFYVGNGFVIVPAFGDTVSDLKAQQTLQQQFPGRTIVPVQISALATAGGGIRCATHEQPAMSQ